AERPERNSVFVISRQTLSRRFAITASKAGSSPAPSDRAPLLIIDSPPVLIRPARSRNLQSRVDNCATRSRARGFADKPRWASSGRRYSRALRSRYPARDLRHESAPFRLRDGQQRRLPVASARPARPLGKPPSDAAADLPESP